MVNEYINRSHLSEAKTREIIRYFACDIEAVKIADLSGVSRNTINRLLRAIRERIAAICEEDNVFEQGSIEMDESYFGARRVRGIRGRGARGKQIVFGLIKRGGNVYTQVVANCFAKKLYPIIKAKVPEDAEVYTDSYRTYDGLVDLGYQKHYRVKHGENEFANGHSHINGIENFWAWAKTRLCRFRGISRKTFYLHLKECEFRFNFRRHNIYRLLLKKFREDPLKLS